MRRLLLLTIAIGTTLTCVASAQADVREGRAYDPKDQPTALSGPSRPDLQRVTARYDSAGNVRMTANFWGPFVATGGGANNHYMNYTLGKPDATGACVPALTMTYLHVTVAGHDGALEATQSSSADGLTQAHILDSPEIAGLDVTCFTSQLVRVVGSTRTVIDSANGYFDGFAPPVNACNDKIDNDGDGKVDLADPGCQGLTTGTSETDPAPQQSTLTLLKAVVHSCRLSTSWTVGPNLHPHALFPFGHIVLILSRGGKQVTHSVPSGPNKGYGFSGLKSGTYALHAYYAGDKYRLKSKVLYRSVHVPKSC